MKSLNNDFKMLLFLVRRTSAFARTLSWDLLLLLKLKKTLIFARTLSQDLLLSLKLKKMFILARTLNQHLLLLLRLKKIFVFARTLSWHLSLLLRLRKTSFRWSENAEEQILLLKKTNVWSWIKAEIQLCIILSKKWRKLYSWKRK